MITVGKLREILKNLPDDMPVLLWYEPDDPDRDFGWALDIPDARIVWREKYGEEKIHDSLAEALLEDKQENLEQIVILEIGKCVT